MRSWMVSRWFARNITGTMGNSHGQFWRQLVDPDMGVSWVLLFWMLRRAIPCNNLWWWLKHSRLRCPDPRQRRQSWSNRWFRLSSLGWNAWTGNIRTQRTVSCTRPWWMRCPTVWLSGSDSTPRCGTEASSIHCHLSISSLFEGRRNWPKPEK